MAYRVGHCPLCDAQIMGKDADGRWRTFLPNFRQADVFFENDSRMRTVVCSSCFDNGGSLEDLMTSITADESEAASMRLKEKIAALGMPTGWALSSKARQGASLKK